MLTQLLGIVSEVVGARRAQGASSARRARRNRAPLIGLALAVMLAGTSAIAAEGGHPAAPAGGPATEAGGEGAHGGSNINPLSFETDLALWTAVVFLVLLAILGKYAWRPISEALEKREQRIADQIAAAEQANTDARQVLTEYQAKLAGSEAEVREILEKGRREAEDLGRQMLDKTRQDAEHERERALREIDAATAGAVKELAARSADLAVELAGKIVQARLDPTEHARLVEQAVAGFAKIEPGKN
jgi:F-type H+-transporting ATPase subunit b